MLPWGTAIQPNWNILLQWSLQNYRWNNLHLELICWCINLFHIAQAINCQVMNCLGFTMFTLKQVSLNFAWLNSKQQPWDHANFEHHPSSCQYNHYTIISFHGWRDVAVSRYNITFQSRFRYQHCSGLQKKLKSFSLEQQNALYQINFSKVSSQVKAVNLFKI